MFKSVFIEGTTLDDTWFQLLKNVYENGRWINIDDGSFKGNKRLEFDFVSGIIRYPNTRPLAPIMPEGVSSVTNDDDIQEYFTNYIMDGWNLSSNEHYKYATWITGGPYVLPTTDELICVPNQLEWCINHFKDKGFGNNHCCIQIGYPESSWAYNKKYTSEMDRGTSPCFRLLDIKIIDDEGYNKLCFHTNFRSQDLYGAWPVNMGGVTLLMEYMANELGIGTGYLSFSAMKLHCYDFQLEPLKIRLGIEKSMSKSLSYGL